MKHLTLFALGLLCVACSDDGNPPPADSALPDAAVVDTQAPDMPSADTTPPVDAAQSADGAGRCATYAATFKVTTADHAETEDLDAVVTQECGATYRLGDWTDVTAHASDIQTWADCVGLKQSPDSLLLANQGSEFYTQGRHYFIRRHDHQTPATFMVHDHIDNHFIDLGSWYNLSMPVLCTKK